MLAPAFRIHSAGTEDDRVEPGRDVGIESGRRLRGREVRRLKPLDFTKWKPAGERFVESDTHGEEFRSFTDRCTAEAFRSEVTGGAGPADSGENGNRAAQVH